jgi:quercetin dioxygenase-like cupin family protein
MHGQSLPEFMRSNMGQRNNLQSGCFVLDQSDLVLTGQSNLRWAQVIGKDDQARKLSLFYLEAGPGNSPPVSAGNSEAVLFLQEGQCDISISGRRFEAMPGTGVHIRSGEQFSLLNESGDVCRWLVSVCPRVEELAFGSRAEKPFDSKYAERTVAISEQKMQATEDRYYQLLVGPSIGSESVTQFIGRIPLSKAPEHFHLYEEAICILSGHGRMWTGKQSAEVRPGSIIFLPRKQTHSLECLDEHGMELMGVFYPAGSPTINYKTQE